MKNTVIIITCILFGSVTINAQSLMDRVNKTKQEANKPVQTQPTQTQNQYSQLPPPSSYNSASSGFVNLRNRWKGTYVHIEYGNVNDTKLGRSDWHSAQWSFQNVAGEPTYVLIKNKWKQSYLNAKNNYLQSSNDVGPGSHSAHWQIIPVPGTNFFKIKNRLHGNYLHNENGSISLGDISPGWHSAQWEKTTVGSGAVDVSVTTYENAEMMYFRYTDQVQGGRGLNLAVGSQIKVLPNQKIKVSPGLSFDPNNPKICGKVFTVASLNPLRFTEPFPENMRNRNNSSFALKVVKLK